MSIVYSILKMNKAYWIVISGLDGSGKTTLKNNLINFYKSNNKNVIGYHSPYDNYLKSMLDISGNGKAFNDKYTDFLIFALDHRIHNYRILDSKEKYDYIISQRGPMDLFVHASVWGYSYEEIRRYLKYEDLEVPDVIIHLNANPKVAYERIVNDLDADKYEYLEYIEKQYDETLRLYESIKNGNKNVKKFCDSINFYLDTTTYNTDEVYNIIIKFLNDNLK